MLLQAMQTAQYQTERCQHWSSVSEQYWTSVSEQLCVPDYQSEDGHCCLCDYRLMHDRRARSHPFARTAVWIHDSQLMLV